MITLTCTNCGQKLDFQAEQAGRIQTCPHCQHSVPIPDLPGTPAGDQEVSLSYVIKALPGSPSNPFRGMDRLAMLAAREGKAVKPYRLLGILGAAVLAVGTFLPLVGAPSGGASLNAFELGGELGSIVMMLAVMGLSLTLSRANAGVLAVALGSLTVTLVNFLQYLNNAVQSAIVQARFPGDVPEVRWGWWVLVVGAVLLLGATIWGEQPPRKQL
jgi:hypothetical protein